MSDNVVPLRHELPWTTQAEADNPTAARTGDERFWSVTTIIGNIGGAGGLTGWTANKVAAAALDNVPIWQAMVDAGQRDEAIRYLANARFRPRAGSGLSDRDAGTAFHAAAEQWIYDGERPTDVHPDVVPLLDSFEQWLDIAQPSFEALEMTVYNPAQHYAGTLDAIVGLNGNRYILDYKTSLDRDGDKRKAPWSSAALQCAAYRWAEFVAVWKARRYETFSRRYYLLSPAERAMAVPMPATDGGLVLHLTPDHADTYVVATGPDVWEAFLAAVDATAWVELHADGVFIDCTLINTGRR